MTKKQLLTVMVLFFLVLLLLFLALYVWKHKPIVPTWQWQGKVATIFGENIPVKTYKILGQKMPIILHIEDGLMLYPPSYPTGEGKLLLPQKWVAVFFSDDQIRAFIPPRPEPFPPYLHSVGDMIHGWDLNRGEFENIWFLSRDGDSIVFSNAVISVNVSKKK